MEVASLFSRDLNLAIRPREKLSPSHMGSPKLSKLLSKGTNEVKEPMRGISRGVGRGRGADQKNLSYVW